MYKDFLESRLKYLLLLFITLLFMSTSSCSKNIKYQQPYTLEEFKLNGKVKTYSITKLGSLHFGGEYNRYHFSSDGILKYEEIKYHENGDYYKYNYIYISDKKDRIKKVILKDIDNDIFQIIYFKYNSDGFIKWKNITSFDFFGNSFTYDQDITKIKYKSGFIVKRSYYKYDIFFNFLHSTFDIEKDITKVVKKSDDLLILKCWGSSKSNILDEYISDKYSYFSNYLYYDNILTQGYIYDKNEIIYSKYDYHYDSKNNVINIKTYDILNVHNSNDYVLSRTESFEYDDKNNKIYELIVDHCDNGIDNIYEEIRYIYEYY